MFTETIPVMFWDFGFNVLVLTHLGLNTVWNILRRREEGQAGLLLLSQLGVSCSSVHLRQRLTGQNWANEEPQTGSCGDDVVVISERLICEVTGSVFLPESLTCSSS